MEGKAPWLITKDDYPSLEANSPMEKTSMVDLHEMDQSST